MQLGIATSELAPPPDCPIVLFHSIDDKVASYRSVARWAKKSETVSLVTFSELNHFLQFDVSQRGLRDAILAYLELEVPVPPDNRAPLEEKFIQRSEDARHWSDIVFRLILAFFTVFGALLYFTLEDVLTGTTRASTFLLSYVFILSLYVQLVALYFFYVVRVDVFLKNFVEPLTDVMGWAGFRSNAYVSGGASGSMTRYTSISVVGFPLIGALAVLIYAVVKYWLGDFGPHADNHFHQLAGAVSLIMWFWALRSAVTLNTYTTNSLYRRVPLSLPSLGVAKVVDDLYHSVEPGIAAPSIPEHFEEFCLVERP